MYGIIMNIKIIGGFEMELLSAWELELKAKENRLICDLIDSINAKIASSRMVNKKEVSEKKDKKDLKQLVFNF